MAVKNLYMTSVLVDTYQELSETPETTDALATPRTGWIVAKTASGNYSRFQAQTERAAGTFAAPVLPGTQSPSGVAVMRAGPFTGDFAAGFWAFRASCLAETNSSGQAGRIRVRLWKSANADGSGATDLSGADKIGTIVVVGAGTGTTPSVASFDPGALSLSNEYLFIVAAWEITTAGGNNNADVLFRVGDDEATTVKVTRLATTDFTVPSGTAWDPGTQADALGITDSVSTLVGRNVSQADALAIADSPATTAALLRQIDDALGLTDANTPSVGLDRSQADPLGITDANQANLGKEVNQNDALGIVDQRSFVIGSSFADALALTDVVASTAVMARTVADALGITDQLALAQARALADALGIADTASTLSGIDRSLADTLGITDSATPSSAGGQAITINEVLTITDAVAFQSSYARAVSDALGLSDQAAAQLALARSVAETLGVADLTVAAVDRPVSIADALAVTDIVVPDLTAVVTIVDALSVSDQLATEVGYIAEIADVLGITDELVKQLITGAFGPSWAGVILAPLIGRFGRPRRERVLGSRAGTVR